MLNLSKYRVPFFFLIVAFVIIGTYVAIKFTQGYRFDFSSKSVMPTGMLVVNSSPHGAQVFIDGKLKGATNSTLSLPPGEYLVEIKKPGTFPWQKKLLIEKELVTQANALLFPQVPDLKPLTFTGVENPKISPDGGKIVYSISSPSPQAGLWVLDLGGFLFSSNREPRQIAKDRAGYNFSELNYYWTPDSRQILVETQKEKYLLDPSQLNPSASFVDVSKSLEQMALTWTKEEKIRNEARFKKVPEKLKEILASSATDISFSPDGTKILYTATASAEIPEKLIPPVPASSNQPESRKIEAGRLYVYDIKEDRNFTIPFNLPEPTPTPTQAKSVKTKDKTITPTPTPTPVKIETENWLTKPNWFPSSNHLIWLEAGENGDKVIICEYDGTNSTAVYSGPMVSPFAFVSPGGERLVILTQISFDPESKPNLYSVSLK
ncbi:PEGA domain-containing protein [Candidatus Microgenomates bacterium]|nr:MAG: PEGA domain-containing protein [Candidatus Microgenomates bacterium]